MSWSVYIILTKKGKLYTGIAKDVERRFKEHLKDKKKGAKYFRSDKPKKIVFQEVFESRSAASIREYQIKRLTRVKKMALIGMENFPIKASKLL